MYESRTLNTNEQLYVDKCQEKIAQLGAELALESLDNDVSYEKHQLAKELQYSIETLKSSFLDPSISQSDIDRMISFYSVVAELWKFSGRTGEWAPPPSLPGSGYVTQDQFLQFVASSTAEDLAIRQDLAEETQARIDADQALQDQIDALSDGSAAETTAEITAQISVGGIGEGTVYPIGTPFQTIFEELLGQTEDISNFTFATYSELAEVGQTITPVQFTWTVGGTPQNLVITDNQGNLQYVTNSPANVPWSYTLGAPGELEWTLDGSNTEPEKLVTKVVYATYHGVVAASDDNPVTITTSMFASATKTTQDTALGSITVNFTVGLNQQGWVAVPKVQTAGNFTKWFVAADNAGAIGTGFIIGPVDLTYNGVVYQIYQWGYRSPLNNDLRLYR